MPTTKPIGDVLDSISDSDHRLATTVAVLEVAARQLGSRLFEARILETVDLAVQKTHAPRLDRKGVAAYVPCNVSQVDRARAKGIITPVAHVGTAPVFSREEVDRTLAEGKWQDLTSGGVRR